MLSKWKEMSQSTLKRLKALKMIIRIKNRKLIRLRFNKWVTETNYLIDLDQRIMLLQDKRHRAMKIDSVKKLLNFYTQRNLCRKRNKDIRQYA